MPSFAPAGETGAAPREFDYLIVGGGSAGCVLANRLSADGRYTVCLIEAGPADKSPFIMMPGGIIPLLRSKRYNWQFWTAPQKHCGEREMYWPRGRTLGGSSAINAMCYIRGHAADYDHWAALGNSGWSHAELLPYFRRAQHCELGEDAYNGVGGPLNVAALRSTNPLSQLFLDAAAEAGHGRTEDFNGAQQEGFGWYRVMQKGGQRCSNARAYLREAEARPNLTVLTEAQASRVLFEGRRAVGLRYVQRGKLFELRARREVILAAGAIGSPQLLLLSGVGAREAIEPHGLAMVHELPGVGLNLQDHVDVFVSWTTKTRLGISMHPSTLWRSIKNLFAYLFRREGELTSNIAEAGGFLKTDAAEPIPDLQMHFVPIVNSHHALDLAPLMKLFGMTILTCDLRPRSRGSIRLNSADPLAPPRIDANYLDDPRDLEKLLIGLKKTREILEQPAFAAHRLEEIAPGAAVQDDAALRQWIREHCETLYHPVGSCKMGQDEAAVVDARLRVHGLEGLRVIDASIMPTLVGGNTNAPTTVIAEKGADMVLEDAESVAPEYGAGLESTKGVQRNAA